MRLYQSLKRNRIHTIHENLHYYSKFGSLGRPQKLYFFQSFLKKSQKFTSSRCHHRANLTKNFCGALRSRITTFDWFFEIPSGTWQTRPQFSCCWNSNFWHFLTIFCGFVKNQKRFSLFKLLHLNQFSRKHFGTKTKRVLWSLEGKFLHSNKLLYFLKKSKSPLFLTLPWRHQQKF